MPLLQSGFEVPMRDGGLVMPVLLCDSILLTGIASVLNNARTPTNGRV